MNIADFAERGNPEDMPEYTGKELSKNSPKPGHFKSLAIAIIVLTATASLGLGVLAGQQKSGAGLVISSTPLSNPKTSTLSANALNAVSAPATLPSGGEVVGDTSTHEYYLPWCKQVWKIASSSVKWFASENEATSSGYTAGKACAGI